jgi:hypothetical protein
MVNRALRRLALVVAVALMLIAPLGTAHANQGSYDVVRIELEDGTSVLYRVWLTWPQLLLTTPDGGGWGIITAQAGTIDAPFKLFTARFDPVAAKWTGARAVPGGNIQFGAAGDVDANGIAHVVFTDRLDETDAQFGRVMYMRTTPEGTWTTPVAISEHPDSGHQLAPAIEVDANGVAHVIWQDQRNVSAEARAASPANASIVSCDLTADGICSTDPAIVTTPTTETEIGNRPRLTSDGQRLIATWSVYASSSDTDLASATRIAWASRPLGDPAAPWSATQSLVERGDDAIGGRLVDVATDPTGGVIAVFGRAAEWTSLYYTRLGQGQETWSEPMLLVTGARGAFPTVTVGGDGTAYIAYNVGNSDVVTVAGLSVPAGATTPNRETELTPAEFGSRGQAILSADSFGRVWAMYVFEPLYYGDLAAEQVPNEVHVLRGANFSTEPAPETQFVAPAPAAGTPEAEAPAASDGTGQPEVIGTPAP